MFGHQDDFHDNQQHDDAYVPASATDAAFAADMSQDNSGNAQDQQATDDANPALPNDSSVFSPQPAASDDTQQHDDAQDDAQAAPSFTPYEDHTEQNNTDEHADSDDSHDSPAPAGNSDLLDIKTQALQQLSPLVGHLDQSPEEKFRTTMMMIQANDDQSLVKVAYEAAQAIPDEKTKAQALLDIVNEINYFTHQNGGSEA